MGRFKTNEERQNKIMKKKELIKNMKKEKLKSIIKKIDPDVSDLLTLTGAK